MRPCFWRAPTRSTKMTSPAAHLSTFRSGISLDKLTSLTRPLIMRWFLEEPGLWYLSSMHRWNRKFITLALIAVHTQFLYTPHLNAPNEHWNCLSAVLFYRIVTVGLSFFLSIYLASQKSSHSTSVILLAKTLLISAFFGSHADLNLCITVLCQLMQCCIFSLCVTGWLCRGPWSAPSNSVTGV